MEYRELDYYTKLAFEQNYIVGNVNKKESIAELVEYGVTEESAKQTVKHWGR